MLKRHIWHIWEWGRTC